VRNDAERGRIYLPEEELQRCGVDPESILCLTPAEGFAEAAARFAARARGFYAAARASLPAAERRSMVAAELMGAVYWQLLRKLERGRFQVFGARRVSVGKPAKCALVLRTWLRLRLGSEVSNYGAA
jgi:phytoene synthase